MIKNIAIDIEVAELILLSLSVIAIPWVIWVTSSALKIRLIESSLKRSHERLDRRPNRVELDSVRTEILVEIKYMREAIALQQQDILVLRELLQRLMEDKRSR